VCSSDLAYSDKGEMENAFSDFETAIRLDPSRANPYFNRGRAYEKVNRLPEALADYQRFVELAPNDPDGPAAVTRVQKRLTDAVATPAGDERRVALVIGNSAYAAVPALPNPRRDAASVAEALRAQRFEVISALDATRAQMVSALQNFERQARGSDWALIYYAGHGMEVGGENYLIPVDARIEADTQARDEAVALSRIEDALQGSKKLRLVLLDACRNNPFMTRMTRTAGIARAVSRGLAPVEPLPGAMIVYATRAGYTAANGAGDHSPFTTAFLKEIETPGLEVRLLFDSVRDDVIEATNGEQQPFTYGSLSGRQRFFFKR
jgi:uncharacterized caspase-like protein